MTGPVHRRQGLIRAVAEAQLEPKGLKIRAAKLRHHVFHHGANALFQAAEEVPEAGRLMLHAAQLTVDIVPHGLRGKALDGLVGDLGCAALVLDGSEHMFQNIMHKRAVFRRVKSGGTAGAGVQAVAQEIGKVAGLVLIHPGGRHRDLLPIEGRHSPRRQAPPLPAGGLIQMAKQGRRTRVLREGRTDRRDPSRQGAQLVRGRRWLLPALTLGKERLQTLDQKRGALLAARLALRGPGDIEPLGGLGAGGVDDGIFAGELFLGPGCQFQAVAL